LETNNKEKSLKNTDMFSLLGGNNKMGKEQESPLHLLSGGSRICYRCPVWPELLGRPFLVSRFE
jgi:hypothetical protein